MLTLILLACMHIPIQQDLPYNSVDCDNAQGDPKKCTVEADEPESVIWRNVCCGFLKSGERAADEPDGKPPKEYGNSGNGGGKPDYACTRGDERKECVESFAKYDAGHAVDVPAVQVGYYDPPNCHETKCIHAKTTCADKTRVLWHDESNPPVYWCHKVQP